MPAGLHLRTLRTIRAAATLAGLLVMVPAGAAAPSAGEPGSGGADQQASFDLGGRLMWDMDSFDGVLNPAEDGERRFDSQLRRARIELKGHLPGSLEWVFDVNYLDNEDDFEVHAAGIRYRGWGFADVFVGRTKEPFGLEELTSSKALSTMRRNFLSEATDADNQPNYGLRLDGFAGPVGWSAGVFNPNGHPEKENGRDRLAFTGRLFGAPVNRGEQVLHLGIAYSDRNLDAEQELTGFGLRVAETGERLSTSPLLAREDRQTGLEALFINGPFSLQGEQFWRALEGAGGVPDADVTSRYLQATWTLTGESRGYSAAGGVPGMIAPAGRRVAVELVAKLEHISFDRGPGVDQRAHAQLIGVNYYVNRVVKLMLNVTRVETANLVDPGEDDDGVAVSARIQVAM